MFKILRRNILNIFLLTFTGIAISACGSEDHATGSEGAAPTEESGPEVKESDPTEESLSDDEVFGIDPAEKKSWYFQTKIMIRDSGLTPVLPTEEPPDLEFVFPGSAEEGGYVVSFQQETVQFDICEMELCQLGDKDELLQEVDLEGQTVQVIYVDNLEDPKTQIESEKLDELKAFWATAELSRDIPNWLQYQE